MWASLKGHVEVVDRLIQHAAKVDLRDAVKVCQIASMICIFVYTC